VIAVPKELLRRYAAPSPRYTSYPAVMHWQSAPTEAEWLAQLAAAVAPVDATCSIYAHIPFCLSQCTFCGCSMRLVRNHGFAETYTDLLLKEFALLRERTGNAQLTVAELYLGGGTPTYLPAETLDRLLDDLLSAVGVANDADLCIEVDPRYTSRAQLQVLRNHGFNRISVGVQDFDPRVLEIINRVQSEEEVRTVIDAARELGFSNVSIDLIFGLPLQTADSLSRTLDTAHTLNADRVILLPYAHVPWIKQSQRRYTEADLPDAELRQEMFLLGRKKLGDAGFVEIGIDQYARASDPLAKALKNSTLTRRFMGFGHKSTKALIGLGASALADASTCYVQNEKSTQRYEAHLAAGELPLQRGHMLTAEEQSIRTLLWSLMCNSPVTLSGLTDNATSARSAVGDQQNASVTALAADGLVTLTGQSIAVTPLGRAFLRQICATLDPLNR
jgi:oxygen-independent coproporphyrinogen III oxidase